MSLSKPSTLIFKFVSAYYEGLYNNPIRTKALTSCAVATAGNLTSQYIAGERRLDQDSLVAFGLYGLLFGGTIPHYFYELLESLAPEDSAFHLLKRVLIERFLFTPLYQTFVIYMLARFEGRSHDYAMSQLLRLYWPLLKANWTWLTIPQVMNLRFVPFLLRVMVSNVIGFVWTIVIAHQKRKFDSRRSRLD